MSSKSVQKLANNKRLRFEPAWSLLSSDYGPEIVAILSDHLFDGERRLSHAILHERVRYDLTAFKESGYYSIKNEDASSLIRQWLTSGYLERTFDKSSSEEFYELSAGAIQAIRFIENLTQRRSAATESRLQIVIQQLMRLASETDPNPESRIQSLVEEQKRLQQKIDEILKGTERSGPLSEDRALERLREIIALVNELANEFREVRDQFNRLNLHLREMIIETDESRGGVLEELFLGVDQIADSEAGRTFKAFWSLLTDPEQSMHFDQALEQIMGRDFSQTLKREEKKFLGGMTRTLLERGSEVHDTLQFFSKSLKQYVTSREYLEQKRFSEIIKEAQRLALDIKNTVRSTDKIDYTLHLSSMRLSSVSSLHLYDHSLHHVESASDVPAPQKIDLKMISAMVEGAEINFKQLEGNIRALVTSNGQATIKEILEKYPAEQGLGSVVGYIYLGTKHGDISKDQEELVYWKDKRGSDRCAHIPLVYFQKGRFDVAKTASRRK